MADDMRQLLVPEGKDPTDYMESAIGGVMQRLFHLTDAQRVGLAERFLRMAEELTRGSLQNPELILTPKFKVPEEYDQMIVQRDIPFDSLCEHHLMPFYGRAHVAYIPRKCIVGISKLARLVHCFANRAQLQERLTSQVAMVLWQQLEPLGVGVLIEAQHCCICNRGVKAIGSSMVTSKLLGYFKDDARTREEFLTVTSGHRKQR